MSPKVNGWLWRAVFALAGLVFGAGVAYGAMNYRIGDLCDKVADHETRMRKVEKAVIEANGKLDFLVEQAKEKK